MTKRRTLKKPSDAIINIRKRAKRFVARLQSDIVKGNIKNLRSANAYIAKINQEIEKTYQTKGYTREQAAQAAEKLSSLGVKKFPKVQDRQRKLFANAMRGASRGDTSIYGKFAENISHIFWSSTQRAWQGKGPHERYKAIEEYYGKPLQEVMKDVLRANKGVFRYLLDATRDETRGWTDDEEDLYTQLTEGQIEALPPSEYMILVRQI